MKKIMLIIILIAAVLGGTFFLWRKTKQNNDNIPISQTDTTATNAQAEEKDETPSVRPEYSKELENDQDQDGLINAEEAALQTSIVEVDTDGDGISDANEVKKWKTDPTKIDSDGDGFADMVEIRGGYNPNGEGKLSQ